MNDAALTRSEDQQTVHQESVLRALVSLADSLVADYGTIEMLQRLVDHCVDLLDVSAAGLLLAGQDGRLQLAASTDDELHMLEMFQLHSDQGPCLESFETHRAVVVGDPDEQRRRWPSFARQMHLRGFLGVAALPLRLRDQSLGTLGLFRHRTGTPRAGDLDIAQALADIASIAILQQQAVLDSRHVTAQLQQALDSRVLIEQAKGSIASQAGIGVAEAFALIRNHARTHHLRLHEVAEDIVTGRVVASHLARPGRRS